MTIHSITIDLPDQLFRRAKALAAVRGSSLKELVVRAIEREVEGACDPAAAPVPRRLKFPQVHLSSGRKLDLSKFNFDNLLA